MEVKLENGEAVLWIYEPIGASLFGGVGATDVKDELKDLSDIALHVRINSPGGNAFDAIAIQSLLSQHQKPVRVSIDGLAASAASVVAMGGETVEMASGAMMMIHEPWMIAEGGAEDFRRAATLLDQAGGNIARLYADVRGIELNTVRDAMAAETWYTADEAVEFGLADRVTEAKAVAAMVDPAIFEFRNQPESLLVEAKAQGKAVYWNKRQAPNYKELRRKRRHVQLTRSRLRVY